MCRAAVPLGRSLAENALSCLHALLNLWIPVAAHLGLEDGLVAGHDDASPDLAVAL